MGPFFANSRGTLPKKARKTAPGLVFLGFYKL